MSTPEKPETPEIPWTMAAGREHRSGMTPRSFDPTRLTDLKPDDGEETPATAPTIPAPASGETPALPAMAVYRHIGTGRFHAKLPEEPGLLEFSFRQGAVSRAVSVFELATEYQRAEFPAVEPELQALATIRLFRHRETGALYYLSPASKSGALLMGRVGTVRGTPWVGTASELVATFTECLDETQKPVEACVTPPPGESSPTILPGDLTVGETQAPSFQGEARASYVPELPDGSPDAPVAPSGLTTLPWRVVSTGCAKRRVQVLSLDPVGPDGLRRNYAIETPEGVVLTSIRFQRGCPTLDRNGATEEELLAILGDRLAARCEANTSKELSAAHAAVKLALHALEVRRTRPSVDSLEAPVRVGDG